MNLNWIHTIETSANFPLILKILGVLLFGGSFLAAWGHIPVLLRVSMILGVVVFFIGLRYKTIKTAAAPAGKVN